MIIRILRVLLWLASLLAVVAFAYVAVRRFSAPQPLEPMEGIVLEYSSRIANEQPLYQEPALATPPALMPGFPMVVSLLSGAFGPRLWEPRVVSLAAMLAAAALVITIVIAETRSSTVGVASGGLMLLGCALLAGPPAAARPESLLLALVLGGYVVLRYWKGVGGAVAGAFLLAAASFTQQIGLWFAAAALLYLATEDQTRFVTYSLCIAALCGGGYLLLSKLYGPWFNFYTWDVHVQSLRFEPARLVQYVGDDLIGKLGVLTLTVLLSFALPTRPWLGPSGLWMCLGLATLATGVLGTQRESAGPHALFLSVAALALVGPISMTRVTQHLAAWPGSSVLGGQGVILAALALQYASFLSRLPLFTLTPGT